MAYNSQEKETFPEDAAPPAYPGFCDEKGTSPVDPPPAYQPKDPGFLGAPAGEAPGDNPKELVQVRNMEVEDAEFAGNMLVEAFRSKFEWAVGKEK